MKPIYFGLLVALCLVFPSLSQAQSFKVSTDSLTGKPIVILEDGTVLDEHPALREFNRSGKARAKAPAFGTNTTWKAAFQQGQKQITASRFCYAGAVLVPLAVFYVTEDSAAQPEQIALGAGLGIVLGIIGLGLDAAGNKNYNRSIHLHLDADGVGVGIPLR